MEPGKKPQGLAETGDGEIIMNESGTSVTTDDTDLEIEHREIKDNLAEEPHKAFKGLDETEGI